MNLEHITRNIEERNHKFNITSKIEPILDQILFWGAAESSFLYGLYKIADSPSGNYVNALASAVYAIAAVGLHKKAILPIAKKLWKYDKKKDKEKEKNKQSKVKNALSWLKTGLLALSFYFPVKQDIAKTENFYYNNIVSVKISQVVLDDKNLDGIGRIERTERWLPLIQKYEKEFDVPSFTLYGIVMEESYGDPLHINDDDGGAGLCHWQPASWKERKTVGPNNKKPKVFYDSKVLASQKYAKKLRNLIESANYNFKTLSQIDNRFDIKVNLYETAEMLRQNYDYFKSKGYNDEFAWGAAISSINTGKHGVIKKGKVTKRALKYLNRINQWKSLRQNKDFMKKVEEKFNKKNKIAFNKYVRYFWH